MAKKRLGIIFGPINVGKGTQAQKLSEEFGFYHLTTGGIIRDKIEKEGDEQLKAIIDSGNLISDEKMGEIFKSKLKKLLDSKYDLILLDGIPRTLNQIEFIKEAKLELGFELAWSIWFDAPLEDLIERAKYRVIGPDGTVYNTKFNPPPVSIPASSLKKRVDDSEEVITKRYQVYLNETLPCIKSDYIKNAAAFIRIDARRTIEEIYSDAREFVISQK